MPNWCYTEYTFHENDKQTVINFQTKIRECLSVPLSDNYDPSRHFGSNYLGNVLIGIGLAKDRGDPIFNGISVRGIIQDVGDVIRNPRTPDKEDYVFCVWTETAWDPLPRVWDIAIDYLKYDIKYSFKSEESGAGLYIIEDKFGDYPEHYLLDYYFSDEMMTRENVSAAFPDQSCEESVTIEELVRRLQILFNTQSTSLPFLLRKINEFNDKYSISNNKDSSILPSEENYIFLNKYNRI